MSGLVKKRSENWTDEETFSVISLWKEFVDDLRACKRNRRIYAKIADRLNGLGITKSIESIKSKLQNLATLYKKEKNQLGDTGSSSSPWKFFRAVDEVIGSSRASISPTCHRRTRQESHALTRGYDDIEDPLDDDDDSNFVENSHDMLSLSMDVVDASDEYDSTNNNNVETDATTTTSSASRKQRTKRKRARDTSEELLEQAKRGNDILESMEKRTMDIFAEAVSSQKQALQLQSRSLDLQEALVNAFLKSQNLPLVNTSDK